MSHSRLGLGRRADPRQGRPRRLRQVDDSVRPVPSAPFTQPEVGHQARLVAVVGTPDAAAKEHEAAVIFARAQLFEEVLESLFPIPDLHDAITEIRCDSPRPRCGDPGREGRHEPAQFLSNVREGVPGAAGAGRHTAQSGNGSPTAGGKR